MTLKHYRVQERPYMPGDGGCDAVLYTDIPHQGDLIEHDPEGTRYKSYEEAWDQIAGDATPGDEITVKVLPDSTARLRDDPDQRGQKWVDKKLAAYGEGPYNE